MSLDELTKYRSGDNARPFIITSLCCHSEAANKCDLRLLGVWGLGAWAYPYYLSQTP